VGGPLAQNRVGERSQYLIAPVKTPNSAPINIANGSLPCDPAALGTSSVFGARYGCASVNIRRCLRAVTAIWPPNHPAARVPSPNGIWDIGRHNGDQ
jgi:hypothetical protein